MKLNFLKIISLILLTTSCEGNVQSRGYLPQSVEFKRLEKAKTKADIKDILGTPTFVSKTDNRAWVYTSYKITQTAFFTPEFKNYHVMSFEFDKKGNITSKKIRNIKDKEFAKISNKTTEFSGAKETTFLREVFGNVGAVNPGLAYTTDEEQR